MHSVIGLERGKVRLAPYEAQWPALFEAEAKIIRARLGASVSDLAHIGSTAVPGLVAKPVIDIMLAIPLLRAPVSFFQALLELGYDHRPFDTVADLLFFSKDSTNGRTNNLSVCEAGSCFWIAHIRFRDRLRTDTELARNYVELKRVLAAKFPNDRLGYTEAKDHFIARALGAGRSRA